MNFQELLRTIDKQAFERVLSDYHVEESERTEYYAFIDRLIQKEKQVEPGVLNIRIIEDEDYPDINAGVLSEDGVNYAIDFIPWAICLGYEVEEESIEKVGKEEVAFHILYDMSFDGFDDTVREANIKRITDRIEEFENGKAKTITAESMEEVFALLKERTEKEDD